MKTSNIWIAIVVLAVLALALAWLLPKRAPNENVGGLPINGQTALLGAADPSRPQAVLKTSRGEITVELLAEEAPKTVENFVKLAEAGFYNGTLFHRVIKDFMIQGGDPLSREKDWSIHGRGGPGYTFADELNGLPVVRGVMAMANSGPNTNGSQFFIVTAKEAPWLNGKHTVFGRVVAGQEVVDEIENVPTDPEQGDHPLTDIVLESVKIE